jgi:hypothetical protein
MARRQTTLLASIDWFDTEAREITIVVCEQFNGKTAKQYRGYLFPNPPSHHV